MRWLTGLVLGVLLGAGGYLGYQVLQARRDPCLGRCGPGTRCTAEVCLAETVPAAPSTRRARHRRRIIRSGSGSGQAEESALRQPTAAEQEQVTRGPALGGTDHLDLASSRAGERSAEEVHAKFRVLEEQVIACIDRARAGYAFQAARVVVSFRVERSGRVEKVQIAGPAALQRAGLDGCIRALITRLRFAPSAGSLIVSYPFGLD